MAQPGMMKDSYNDNSQAQASLFDQCRDLFCTAAQDALLPAQDRPFTIAEWGCSHGGNSIAPVLLLCEQLQQRLQQLPANNRSHCQPLQVHVMHTDVTHNDWPALFTCAREYAHQAQRSCPELHVTYAGIGGSMFCRNHPSCSVDLGFSLAALHWQSKKVLTPKKAIFPTEEHLLPEELVAMQQHAVCDLKSFLQLRAEELKPGGMLVLAYPAPPSPDACAQGAGKFNNIPQQVADAMVADGLLQQHEPGMMAAPVFFLPLDVQKQVYSEASGDWELLHFGCGVTCDPVTTAWRQQQASDAELAQAWVNFYRAVSYEVFASALQAAGRTAAEAQQLVHEFFERAQQAAEATPTPVEFAFVAVLLRRR